MNNRPTLERQIAISKMTDEECIDALIPHGFGGKLEFFIFCHFYFLWCIFRWKWYDKRTDSYSFKEYIKSLLLKETQ